MALAGPRASVLVGEDVQRVRTVGEVLQTALTLRRAMAKKKPRYFPVQRKWNLTYQEPEGSPRKLVRVDQHLGQLNHRHYRQGRIYRGSVEITPDYVNQLDVYVLVNNWQLHAGWRLAYQMYLNNTHHEREILKSNVARWEDFRVNPGVTADLASVRMYDSTLIGSAYGGGEYQASQVQDTTNAIKTFTFSGSSASTYGILEEWSKSYTTSSDPSVPALPLTGGYVSIQNEVDPVVHANLQDHGSEPPYDQVLDYPQCWVRVARLDASSANGTQKLSTGMIDIPLGFILLVPAGAGMAAEEVTISVASGDYKGVASWPIGTPQLQNDKSWKVV